MSSRPREAVSSPLDISSENAKHAGGNLSSFIGEFGAKFELPGD